MSGDKKNIGLSEAMSEKLKDLYDRKVFKQQLDGYRLAATIALYKGLDVKDRNLREDGGEYKNKFDVGAVDEEQIMRNAIREIYPDQEGKEYAYLEKLADAGIEIISNHEDSSGILDIEELMSR